MEEYTSGAKSYLNNIIELMKRLTDLYYQHIEVEDKHFFLPVMDYFDKSEHEQMLDEFYDFDREMIHDKYRNIVQDCGKRIA